MNGKSGAKYPRGFEILANYVRLDTCITTIAYPDGRLVELSSPRTVFIRKCADRVGYTVYKGKLWHVEMRDDGGAYMVSQADLSVLSKVS